MLHTTMVVLTGLMLAPALAAAQQGVEIGFDAGASYMVNSNSIISAGTLVPASASVPLIMPGAIRVALPVGTRVAIEPRVGFSIAKADGGDAIIATSAAVGIPFDLSAGHRGAYVRPFGTFLAFTGGGEDGAQVGAGAGIGYRTQVAERLAMRLETFYEHGFSNSNLGGADNVGVLVGLSMFTK